MPNRHFEEWLHKTFHDALAAVGREVFGRADDGALRHRPAAFPGGPARAGRGEAAFRPPGRGTRDAARARRRILIPARRGPRARPPPPPAEEPAAAPKRTRRWRKLSEFVVGPCNRVAHASALSVVEAPGEGPNPLVLHGPVGTGKTHLLEGIYAGLRRAHADWRVLYVTTEDFTNRFVQAMRLGKLGAFRKHFRECDALLVDDLHFLAGKKATQEEFLHTFDALLADGRQMVLTCDCHPRLADDFTPELTDRLLGGAVWGLAPPDADVRLAVLRARAAAGRDCAARRGAAIPGRPAARQRARAGGGAAQRPPLRPRGRSADEHRRWRERRWPTCCGTRCGWCGWRTWTARCGRCCGWRPAPCRTRAAPGRSATRA